MSGTECIKYGSDCWILCLIENKEPFSAYFQKTSHKYLQCRQGLFPTAYFFGRATGAGEISAQQAKAALLRQSRAEDPKKPLSDQALTEALAGEGMPLARRTVAKYRKALGLPPAYRRKH